MTSFTDQFDRRDPLTFNAFGMLNMWPRQIAWEARQLLVGRSRDDVERIARQIDAFISDEALRALHRLINTPAARGSANPKTEWTFAAIEDPRAVDRVRLEHGDVNLLEAAGEHASSPDFAPHEAFATLALWKLVDCYDLAASSVGTLLADILVVDGEPYRPSLLGAKDVRTLRKAASARNSSAVEAIEAMRACTMASQLKRQAAMMDDVKGFAGEAVQLLLAQEAARRRQEWTAQAQRLAGARWASKGEHEREALEMARSGTFRSRAAAARAIADNLEKTPGEFYTVETIDGWLKKAGWKATL